MLRPLLLTVLTLLFLPSLVRGRRVRLALLGAEGKAEGRVRVSLLPSLYSTTLTLQLPGRVRGVRKRQRVRKKKKVEEERKLLLRKVLRRMQREVERLRERRREKWRQEVTNLEDVDEEEVETIEGGEMEHFGFSNLLNLEEREEESTMSLIRRMKTTQELLLRSVKELAGGAEL